jgi:nitrite reductase (NO-forming)
MDHEHRVKGKRPAARLAGAIAALTLILAACGGSGSSATEASDGDAAPAAISAPNQRISLEALDNSFSVDELSLRVGEVVELTLSNSGSNPHTFTSSALGVDTGTVAAGESATVTFTVPDEPAEFFCSLHGPGGMTGVIVPE